MTKFGINGIISIGKAVLVVGGVIGRKFDFAEIRIIENRAYQIFIKSDLTVLSGKGEAVGEGEESGYIRPHFDRWALSPYF